MHIKRDALTRVLATSLVAGAISTLTVAGSAFQLEKSGPVVCSGDERLTIKNRHIETSEIAIRASGECELVLEDSEVVAGDVGVLTNDRAVVRIEDSRITGRSRGILAKGESQVSFRNSIITGGVDEEDEAAAKNAGGSVVR